MAAVQGRKSAGKKDAGTPCRETVVLWTTGQLEGMQQDAQALQHSAVRHVCSENAHISINAADTVIHSVQTLLWKQYMLRLYLAGLALLLAKYDRRRIAVRKVRYLPDVMLGEMTSGDFCMSARPCRTPQHPTHAVCQQGFAARRVCWFGALQAADACLMPRVAYRQHETPVCHRPCTQHPIRMIR